jgi:hypothetical protein
MNDQPTISIEQPPIEWLEYMRRKTEAETPKVDTCIVVNLNEDVDDNGCILITI